MERQRAGLRLRLIQGQGPVSSHQRFLQLMMRAPAGKGSLTQRAEMHQFVIHHKSCPENPWT